MTTKSHTDGVAQTVGMRAALERAQKIIERDYPNGQLAIDIRAVLGTPPDRYDEAMAAIDTCIGAAQPPAAPVETEEDVTATLNARQAAINESMASLEVHPGVLLGLSPEEHRKLNEMGPGPLVEVGTDRLPRSSAGNAIASARNDAQAKADFWQGQAEKQPARRDHYEIISIQFQNIADALTDTGPQPMPVNAAMAQFVAWAMQEGPWSGNELDGADVQDKARKLGLLVETKYDPEIHGESEFDIEPGDDWYVLAPEITSPLTRPQSQTACTWPNCDQPSGHDYCYDHCLDATGRPTAMRPHGGTDAKAAADMRQIFSDGDNTHRRGGK